MVLAANKSDLLEGPRADYAEGVRKQVAELAPQVSEEERTAAHDPDASTRSRAARENLSRSPVHDVPHICLPVSAPCPPPPPPISWAASASSPPRP